MSDKELQAEVRRRGGEVRKRNTNKEATSIGCFDACLGRGSNKKEEARMETVYEDDAMDTSDFEFRPRTQLQYGEGQSDRWTPDVTETPTPIETPDLTPTATAEPTPMPTPPMSPPHGLLNLYYGIDDDGAPLSDTQGKRVISRMHELMWVYFPTDILRDWRLQPSDSKNALLEQLHREFPNPMGHRFNDKVMLALMGHVLKSRRGMARQAANVGGSKPPGISSSDWTQVKEERRMHPNRWDQQRAAVQKQAETTGISKLGSGGKAHFKAKFAEVVGRKPTRAEYEEGRDGGMSALLQRLKDEGVVFPPQRSRPMEYAIGPNLEIESEGSDEDEDYVPSDMDETEDEVVEHKVDADVWLMDVQHPSSSCRPKGHR